MEDIYEKIAKSICKSTGQCVLILGPELSVNNDTGTNYKVFFRDLVKDKDDVRYFASENLFLCKSRLSREFIQDKVNEFYSHVGDPALMEMISRIPFPLVINVCPDKALNKIYSEKHIDYFEGYFSKDSKTEFNTIQIPSKEKPVIYNIFGSVEFDKSMILTHNRLYETFEYLLPEKSLPDYIEYYLQNRATSFIFLGFKFDSWQYQLICHKLRIKIGDEPKTNISTPLLAENDDVAIIMNSSFNMEPTQDNSFQCISKIIEHCEKIANNCIRPKNPHSQYSTFISYAWNDKKTTGAEDGDSSRNVARENIVELIESKLQSKNPGQLYQFFKDKNDLKFGDSIYSFMSLIGKGKIVIRIISDKYLKSYYCMTETMIIHEHNDPEKRIFDVVLEDVNIRDAEGYKSYWLKEIQKLVEDPVRLSFEKPEEYAKIFRYVDAFVKGLDSEYNLRLKYTDIIRNDDGTLAIEGEKLQEFEKFISELYNKITD